LVFAIFFVSYRISLNKENPEYAPSSPQGKANKLLSMLKGKVAVAAAIPPSAGGADVSPSTGNNAFKSVALLSALKGGKASAAAASQGGSNNISNNSNTNSNTSSNTSKAKVSGSSHQEPPVPCLEAVTIAAATTTPRTKSKQLMALMKSPAASAATTQVLPQQRKQDQVQVLQAETTSSSTGNSIKVGAFGHIKVSSAAQVSAPPGADQTQQQPLKVSDAPNSMEKQQPIDDIQRAQLMLRMIKPRTTSLSDLLTDVDIAAKVKLQQQQSQGDSTATKRQESVAVSQQQQQQQQEAESASGPSCEEKQDLLKNILMGKTKPPLAPSVPATATATATATAAVPPVPPVTMHIAAAAALFSEQGSSTQRSADLLAEALRMRQNTATASRSAVPTSSILSAPLSSLSSTSPGPTLASVPVPHTQVFVPRSASSSPLLTGMPGPTQNSAAGTAAGGRIAPVLFSPSDLKILRK
jgi:hypothetical protein